MPLILDGVVSSGQVAAPPKEEPRTRIIWVSPNGDRVVCTDRDGDVVLGMDRSGEDLPPVGYTEDDVVDGHGTSVRAVRASARTYMLPIVATRATWGSWRAVQQRVARALWCEDNHGRPAPGTLIVEHPDGTSRRCESAYYAGGAEGQEINNHPVYFRAWALSIRCTDPFPHGEDITVEWGAGEPVPTFPILPLRLGSSRVLGTQTVHNDGDRPTLPVFTVQGPVDGLLTLRSETLGAESVYDLSGAHAVAAGEVVTVDMRRGPSRGVRGPDGSSWWSARVGVPTMWPIVPGMNDLTATADGAVAGQTKILARAPRIYLTF